MWDNIKGWFGVSPAKAGELNGSPKGSQNDPVYVKPIFDPSVGPGYPGGTGWQPGLFAGPYGTTPGGRFAAPGAGFGPGRTSSGTYPGKIAFPSGGRGRTGSAGFGLYASDVGLAANKDLNAMDRAFLDTFATGETPSGSYSNVDHDPGGLGGRYQFLRSTWVNWARRAGLDPGQFSAVNQDKAALLYASTLVKQKTGKDLDTLLGSGPDGVRQAISAISPGAWNAITNIDRDKRGHSGGIALFFDKLKKEEAAVRRLVTRSETIWRATI